MYQNVWVIVHYYTICYFFPYANICVCVCVCVQVISCRAAVAWEPKQPLSLETVEVGPPRKGEVRVQVNHMTTFQL